MAINQPGLGIAGRLQAREIGAGIDKARAEIAAAAALAAEAEATKSSPEVIEVETVS